jgi:hypothetical protein
MATKRTTPPTDPTAVSVAFIRGPERPRLKEAVIFFAMAYYLESKTGTGNPKLDLACQALRDASDRAIRKAEYRAKSNLPSAK